MFGLSGVIALLGRFQTPASSFRRSAMDRGHRPVLRLRRVPRLGSVDLARAASAHDRPLARARESLNDRRGFALVLFLSLLPAGLALMFALLAGSTVIRERRTAMNACRRDLMKGLSLAAEPMQLLLKTNVVGRALRAEQAYWLVIAAASVTNPAALATATAKLAANRRQQEQLDEYQKLLFKTAEAHLSAAQAVAFARFAPKKTFLKIWAWPPRRVRPAVHPVGPGPAPDWEKDDRFSESQTLEQKWHWSFVIQGTAGKFVRGAHTQEETCSATLDDQGPSFTAALR